VAAGREQRSEDEQPRCHASHHARFGLAPGPPIC
jgi:hypothetical protein